MSKSHKAKKQTKNFMDYDDDSHHVFSKVKNTKQRKANNMIDKLLKRKDIESIKKLEDVY